MDIVIISATPRAAAQSNTAMFARAFLEGLSQAGASASIYYLADKKQWPTAQQAFLDNSKIIFILPIFTGGIPALMAEFIELSASRCPEYLADGSQRDISFIVHAGLPMDCDFKFCAQFLRTLPEYLNSTFSGILGIGDTIGIDCMESARNEALEKLWELGESYAKNQGVFYPEESFWVPDVITQEKAKPYCRLINRFMRHISAAQGCEESLDQQPYQKSK